MFDRIELGIEFLEGLRALDAAIVERAAAEKCRDCAGPLHRGDYPRKPRGGLVAPDADGFTRRFSLCCGRDGCRHRATPPSVRLPTARLRRRRCDRRERGGPRRHGCRVGAARNRRSGAHAAALASLVARSVHDERSVRGAVGTAGPLVVAKRTADFDPATIGRRAGRAHPAIAGLAGPHHDGEFARWKVTFSAGSRMTDRAAPCSRRRWRYPCFLALA